VNPNFATPPPDAIPQAAQALAALGWRVDPVPPSEIAPEEWARSWDARCHRWPRCPVCPPIPDFGGAWRAKRGEVTIVIVEHDGGWIDVPAMRRSAALWVRLQVPHTAALVVERASVVSLIDPQAADLVAELSREGRWKAALDGWFSPIDSNRDDLLALWPNPWEFERSVAQRCTRIAARWTELEEWLASEARQPQESARVWLSAWWTLWRVVFRRGELFPSVDLGPLCDDLERAVPSMNSLLGAAERAFAALDTTVPWSAWRVDAGWMARWCGWAASERAICLVRELLELAWTIVEEPDLDVWTGAMLPPDDSATRVKADAERALDPKPLLYPLTSDATIVDTAALGIGGAIALVGKLLEQWRAEALRMQRIAATSGFRTEQSDLFAGPTRTTVDPETLFWPTQDRVRLAHIPEAYRAPAAALLLARAADAPGPLPSGLQLDAIVSDQ